MKPSSLNPCWARIIHRLHTLGVVESSYSNSLSKLTEVGRYPYHITSANESTSQSIDESIFWNFINWQQGLVTRGHSDSTIGTEFNFHSIKNTVFHSLRLLEQQHGDCLKCLLQLFSHQKPITEAQPINISPHFETSVSSLAHICEQALSKTRGANLLKVDILTEGGIVSKSIIARNLKIYKNQVRLVCDKETSLDLFAPAISHVQTSRVGNEIHTSLFNASHLPQTTLRICA
jgi:hypothetical protein